jgi:hypothetical protein
MHIGDDHCQPAGGGKQCGRANRDLAVSGVESAYRKQIQGITRAYQLNLDAELMNLSGALKATEIMRSSGMIAVRLDQLSQIVSITDRDLTRRTEMSMTLRY